VERLRKVEVHAAEAGRKAAALRRELAQVKARAIQARTRRALETRRDQLANLLKDSERMELEAALRALDAEASRLRRDLAALETARLRAAEARRRVEAELQTMAAGKGTSRVTDEGAAARGAAIHAAAKELDAIADRLDREGRRGWPAADEALGRVSGAIQEIRRPGSEDPAARCASRLAELRAWNDERERLDREHSALAAELAARDCERARLEERAAALGPSDPRATAGEGGDPRVLREELAAAARDLALLGPVDETAEHRERDLLKEQAELAPVLQDLAAAARHLSSFIRQMEEHTSHLFGQTLARVDARFRALCGILFQGGDARLEARERSADLLSDPPGIDVRVRLPRKPEVSLGLLSGGERSLAGLALILSLAEGNGGEGRLLILDEVDAALDEANAARLALLLRELQRDHQILCVTHNRLTMHQASRLVGVASGATSTSTLLKVSLQSA